MVHPFEPLGASPPTPQNTDVPHLIVTDLTICSSSPIPCERPHIWRRIEKDLYLWTLEQSAWLYIALANEEELTARDLLVIDVKISKSRPNPSPGHSWESRPCGIWVLRSNFSGDTRHAVTELDVLFGIDAVDPRPKWALMESSLQLNPQPKIPVTMTVHYGRDNPVGNDQPALRVGKDGKFKIVQISDMHMVTGVGVCKDALDAYRKNMPQSEADPLTVNFVGKILDVEKPDLVIFTGDLLHHDIPDSLTALLKAVAPVIKRKIPFAAVFGNHDTEGEHALSRMAQMSILQNLPGSLCKSGPEQIDGIGNFYLHVLAPEPSQLPLSTLYLLDSHGQIQSQTNKPDYDTIKESQIEWLRETTQAQRSDRPKHVKDHNFYLPLLFQHIPLPEFRDLRLIICSGHRREPTECPSINSGLYNVLVEEGILVVSCGHDHTNDFCALLPQPQLGPWLCHAGACGFGGYCSYNEERFHRRTRIFLLNPSTGCLETWLRVEYTEGMVDKTLLVENGAVACDLGPF
ncbi:Metallo-dependent phosphatase-like protein [Dendryphion nanum]|uniref:Metallo-dependent phosphatase-like protein n=1 Tax=Dendryphion nanum TaxID=256645 RepID=A0A9P9EE49_9PLEO|nr:Metallo-dependent phosphatase-like protein [Dendryphion nanum]